MEEKGPFLQDDFYWVRLALYYNYIQILNAEYLHGYWVLINIMPHNYCGAFYKIDITKKFKG